MSDDIEEEKIEKMSNMTDIIFIAFAACAFLLKGSYPEISKFLTTFVGSVFIVMCLPHFYMMYKAKTIFNYHFLSYIIKTYHHRVSFVLRNLIVYFIYYYIWYFNQNDVYFFGLSLILAFDLVLLANVLSSKRIVTLKSRLDAMPKPPEPENK